MAEQAEKAKQTPEKKPQVERVDQSEGEGFETSPELAAGLLSLQQSAGNRAVGRLVRGERLSPGSRAGVLRQMAHASAITPGSAPAGLIQLFRSGRVSSNIRYEEGPEDEVTIQIPYALQSYEDVLLGIDQVIQTFGSRGRSYVQERSFNSSVYNFLRSVGHASTGGSPMNRERYVSIRVRLVRGERNRLEGVEYIPEEAPSETATETAESRETGAVGEGTEAPASSEAETLRSETGEAATVEQTQQAPEERSLWNRIFSGVAEATSRAAEIQTARASYNQVNTAMANLENTLAQVGERGIELHAEEQAITPVIVALFTAIRSITGMADLMAQFNLTNAALQVVTREARVLAGEYGLEEFTQDMRSLIELGTGLTIIGQVQTAWEHLEEAWEEGNIVRLWQGLIEVVTAVLAVFGALSAIRGIAAPTRGATPRTAPAEPGRLPAPAEPARIAGPAEPSAAPVEAPVRTGRARTAAPAEAVPAEVATETVAAPEPVPAEAAPGPAAGPESAQSAQAPRPPRSRIAARREAARQRYEEIGLPGVVRRIFATAEEARVRFAYYEQNNMRVIALDHAEFVAEWNRLGEGSLGQSAAAWVDGTNLLRIDRSLVPEARSMSPMASAVQRPSPRPAQPAPTEQVGVEARRAAARQRFEEIGLPGVVRNILETAEAARTRYVFYEQNNMRVIALDHAEFVAEWNRLGEGGIGRSAAAWVDGTNLLRIDRSLVPEARTITPMASAAPRTQAESAAAQPPTAEPVQQGAAPSAQEGATGQQPSRNVGGGEQVVPERPRPAAAGRTPEIEAAARAGGIREFFLSTEVEAARGVLADMEASNLPVRGASAAAMEQRWNILVGTGETPIAILLEDGSFLYNRRILTPE